MEKRTSRIPHDQWIQPISEFTSTRQNLPHMSLAAFIFALLV